MTNKSILISTQPKWVEKILNREKSIEIRKTIPKIATPFKCYIYCTNKGRPLIYNVVFRGTGYDKYIRLYGYSKKEANEIWDVLNGKVVGEFVCDRIDEYAPMLHRGLAFYIKYGVSEECKTCVSHKELEEYGKHKTVYGWHISNLKIYDKPKELSEFYTKNLYTDIEKMFTDEKRLKNGLWVRPIKRPPQSWCYVEALKMGEE